MKLTPIVVLLATYNGEKYLVDFLESLCGQSEKNFKVIVRDDGSTDGTLHILESYQDKLQIEIMESVKRLGPAFSFLELLKCCGDQFDFYFFADQDDYWHASKIERAIDKLVPCKDEVGLYCSQLEYVDENLVHINYSRIPEKISFENALVENIATGCTVAINDAARQLIIDNPPKQLIMHDWWFYIVASAFGKVIYDPFPSIKYRQHGNNTIGAATNLLQDFKRRLSRFIKSDGGIFGLAKQAGELKRCFSSLFEKKQLTLVNSIIDGKDCIPKRVSLALFSKLVRQRWFDTFILRILFLSGRF